MTKKRRPKKPRGSRGERTATSNGKPSEKRGVACDLNLLLPKNATPLQSQLQIRDLLSRLSSTGFTHVALTHAIYGRPKPLEDKATKVIPETLWMTRQEARDETTEPKKKKRKSSPEAELLQTVHPSIHVLRRLHAVLENISDVGCYLSNSPEATLLNEYDVISVAPRNEATFQSVCASATAADIITLDYSSTRGLKLPFKIRSSDVQAVIDRKAAFEINFAPALLKPKYRKALVQTCRELQIASAGKTPLVLFSSGDRTLEDSDVGPMALRTPGDLANLMHALLQFDSATANRAVGQAALDVLQRANDRKWGKSDILDISIGGPKPIQTNGNSNSILLDGKTSATPNASNTTLDDTSDNDDDNGPEDGFISMT